MWSITFKEDALSLGDTPPEKLSDFSSLDSCLVKVSVSLDSFLNEVNKKKHEPEFLDLFQYAGKVARVTLAHLVVLSIYDTARSFIIDNTDTTCTVEPLSLMRQASDKRKQAKRRKLRRLDSSGSASNNIPPFIFERSDIWCDAKHLHISLALIFDHQKGDRNKTITQNHIEAVILDYMKEMTKSLPSSSDILAHIGCVLLQNKLRESLQSNDAIAFLADGSIIPRKSGVSFAPMKSPPAIPFLAPQDSKLSQSLCVDVGGFAKYLKHDSIQVNSNLVTVSGLLVPKGVTLIVGGGYHGKSTMLRAIMCGVYDKILGDGREFCVTDIGAVSVRAEDGRYVNNTNVAESIEMKATALLVDEDVSAANFMSRDGKMRALVMDESITPLIYRVNGLYSKHGISSIVVVGGVGDWLDVPNAVIKLDRYVASDALAKAQSISRQFSHHQVQYAGRGTVHRLQWDSDGTPCRRRPVGVESITDFKSCRLDILDGGKKLSIHQVEEEDGDDSMNGYDSDDDTGIIDMSRSEQLFGGNHQLFACGICCLWILIKSQEKPELDLVELVNDLEKGIDNEGGMMAIVESLSSSSLSSHFNIHSDVIHSIGHIVRPRRYEILQALTRIRGIKFEHLPTEVDEEDLRIKKEAEERKRMLAELWANRRNKKMSV
ncbi:hypothetical protein CTEN210_15773 [Chaetoceros tenuissimus]|uniref:ATPase of the ABC class C-terminal domain-containing protein n=1 Tax=Chaetoceros tenuissimus TaxID=426638 RepID=A0AAD3HCZ9_9STRA|nr:hypothetical protein CTEN210_15773 [Chaetoceros tenuissimus]